MKLRKILVGLWAVLLLLVGTCYAEDTENPIIAYIDYGYYRLNMPSVKKVEYYGYSFIECSYTRHLEQMLPYGIPYVTQSGPYYAWFDPLNNKMLYLDESQPNADKNWYDMSYLKDIGGESQYAYNAIRDSFPNLCEEVLTDNQLASEKYGNEISKAIAAQKDEDWKTEYNSLKQAYDKGCQSQGILRDLAESAWKSGDYDTAIEWAGKRIEMNPSGDAYNTRAWWYYLLGQNDKALEDAEWAVFKDKNYAYILDTRGSIYYELGQYDKAIADFNAAIKLDDKFAHAYFYRSKCYEALGNKDKSNADYKKAKKYDNEIIDDKTEFANQQSQIVAKNQLAHQQKLNKYKDTLKKLNDAVYVCNNASQFPKRTVFDSANAIIIDTEKIKYDEGEEFYQEVIPQEVRNNYENGVYQQQYEQLKAEVEAEEAAAAAAAVAVNEPQIAAAPVDSSTLASDYIHEMYKGLEDVNYMISYEESQKTTSMHGKYRVGKLGPSFDYDASTKTFTFYSDLGIAKQLNYDSSSNAIIEKSPSGETTIYRYMSDGYGIYDYFAPDSLSGLRSFPDEWYKSIITQPFSEESVGRTYTIYNNGNRTDTEQLILYKEVDTSHLPTMWYKLTNAKYPPEWAAFTYDKATGTFTLYFAQYSDVELNVRPTATFRFLDDTHIAIHSLKYNADDILVADEDGKFVGNKGNNLYYYVTEGLRLFRQRTQYK
ncbi:tetratricopeptide repeat protein [uncultured Anaerovibrio sp.]|uniref:tetratricopeptide repeat protein n=1 Tax=uncultured Anaerovibrio sp. TaxID=361586 RepID=UPI0025F9C8FD|nr:tetratricopeptide repeat protein [uncultured Anaerovibrio sp.]